MVATCAVSLLEPGTCCAPDCGRPAVVALLYGGGEELTECARCLWHVEGVIVASKPFPGVGGVWAPTPN